jgi:mRNA interferase RelE/StbE
MDYQVTFSSSARRQFKKLPLSIQPAITLALEELAQDPRLPGFLKMKGADNAYRIRVGDYRIVYETYDHELLILVIRIGHRRDVYKR